MRFQRYYHLASLKQITFHNFFDEFISFFRNVLRAFIYAFSLKFRNDLIKACVSISNLLIKLRRRFNASDTIASRFDLY